MASCPGSWPFAAAGWSTRGASWPWRLIASSAHRPLPGQRHGPDPAVCHRRVPVLHPVAGRHGPPLVEDRPPGARARGRRARATAPLRARLAAQDGAQRLWRGLHRRRDVRLCRHQVPRRRLDRPAADALPGRSSLPTSIATTATWPPTCRWRTMARRRPSPATGSSCPSAACTAARWPRCAMPAPCPTT